MAAAIRWKNTPQSHWSHLKWSPHATKWPCQQGLLLFEDCIIVELANKTSISELNWHLKLFMSPPTSGSLAQTAAENTANQSTGQEKTTNRVTRLLKVVELLHIWNNHISNGWWELQLHWVKHNICNKMFTCMFRFFQLFEQFMHTIKRSSSNKTHMFLYFSLFLIFSYRSGLHPGSLHGPAGPVCWPGGRRRGVWDPGTAEEWKGQSGQRLPPALPADWAAPSERSGRWCTSYGHGAWSRIERFSRSCELYRLGARMRLL